MDDNNKSTAAQLSNTPTGIITSDFALENICDNFKSNDNSLSLPNNVKLVKLLPPLPPRRLPKWQAGTPPHCWGRETVADTP